MSNDRYTRLCERIVAHCCERNWYGPDMLLPNGEDEFYEDGAFHVHHPLHDLRAGFAFAPATEEQLSRTEEVMGFAHAISIACSEWNERDSTKTAKFSLGKIHRSLGKRPKFHRYLGKSPKRAFHRRFQMEQVVICHISWVSHKLADANGSIFISWWNPPHQVCYLL